MSAIALPATTAGGFVPQPPPAGAPGPWKFTREQFQKLHDLGFFRDRRVQLVFGQIIEEPVMNWPHARSLVRVHKVLQSVFAVGHWIGAQAPFAADESLPFPDFAVYPGSLDDYTDHPTAAALVVEISDSTLNFDMTTKAELYATPGVPEYWVLDLDNRQLVVLRDPAPLPAGLGATAYRTHTTHGPADTVAPLAAPNSPVAVADLLP